MTQVTVSKLNMAAMTLVTLPCGSADEIIAHHGLSRCGIDVVERDVSGAEPDFVVGKWINWQGNYWVYEIRTGIIHYSNSLADAKEWIKLCRDALKEAAQ